MQQSSRYESAEKHVCNEQTSSNMSRNSRLKKNFRISRDTNKIVLHVIKQCLQAVHHLCCRSYTHYAGYTRTSHSNHQSVNWSAENVLNRFSILLRWLFSFSQIFVCHHSHRSSAAFLAIGIVPMWRYFARSRFRDGNGSSFVTHDACDPSYGWPMTHMTHDSWPLHHFILRMGLGGGVAWWYWTTLSVFRAKKS